MRYLLLTIRPIAEDLAGTLAFYLLFLLTDSAWLGAAVGLGLGLAQLGCRLARRRRPPSLLLLGVGLTVVLGGMTLVTENPRFLMLKPQHRQRRDRRDHAAARLVLRYVPQAAHELFPPATFNRIGWSWAALMIGTALANALLVAALSPRLAVGVLAIGAAGPKLALFALQGSVLSGRARRAYAAQESEKLQPATKVNPL